MKIKVLSNKQLIRKISNNESINLSQINTINKLKLIYKKKVFSKEFICKHYKINNEEFNSLLFYDCPFLESPLIEIKLSHLNKLHLYSKEKYKIFEDIFDKNYPNNSSYKYKVLIGEYLWMQNNMCNGIGMEKVLEFLYSESKTDSFAHLLHLLLVCEDCNISAKIDKLNRDYEDEYYAYLSKGHFINMIRNSCSHRKNVIYGRQNSLDMGSIVYFEFKDIGQISFHVDLGKNIKTWPTYPKSWDCLKFSTLIKLENIILEKYADKLS